MKESEELQAFCDNAKTFEESMECFNKALQFAEKWQVPQPLAYSSFARLGSFGSLAYGDFNPSDLPRPRPKSLASMKILTLGNPADLPRPKNYASVNSLAFGDFNPSDMPRPKKLVSIIDERQSLFSVELTNEEKAQLAPLIG